MTDEEQDKTIVKVKIPQEHRTRLQGLKLLTGNTLSETVTEALEVYFERLKQEGRAEVRP